VVVKRNGIFTVMQAERLRQVTQLGLRLCRRQLQLGGHARQVRQGRCPYFLHYSATMNFCSNFTYVEVGCDLLVQPPARHERHNPALSRGQSFEMNFKCQSAFKFGSDANLVQLLFRGDCNLA
jgi:hypothetical protein